ncbi:MULTISPECIES: thermonuclease family protein [Paenibacillus]|uniref:thermonuclease family protein n=1 Tax=Paenibacillus TaxID=44249 RepID=UPI0022B8B821|nr:thermonuclease family protein [Paenibacillus caseinilyticus]MCZ8520224.1 thermonuclease family protein [Paenibacillus caseinilyticus]
MHGQHSVSHPRHQQRGLPLPLLLVLAILIAICGCSSPQAAGGMETAIYKAYPDLEGRPLTETKVKRVVDGDTFETSAGEKVRLIGVNTPETVKPGSPVQPYGKQASAFTKGKLTGQTVILFADTGDKDRYGRLLRYVFIKGEAVMFNETLVREGYANTMTIQPNVMFQDLFRHAEKEARLARRGLWGEGDPPKESATKKK